MPEIECGKKLRDRECENYYASKGNISELDRITELRQLCEDFANVAKRIMFGNYGYQCNNIQHKAAVDGNWCIIKLLSDKYSQESNQESDKGSKIA